MLLFFILFFSNVLLFPFNHQRYILKEKEKEQEPMLATRDAPRPPSPPRYQDRWYFLSVCYVESGKGKREARETSKGSFPLLPSFLKLILYRDKQHVRLPCSPKNVQPMPQLTGTNRLMSRWELMQTVLRTPILDSYALEEAILSYNPSHKVSSSLLSSI